MKTITIPLFFISVFIANPIFAADMNDKTMMDQSTMSKEHATHNMSNQMMNTESMRNMMKYMEEVRNSLQHMSQLMEKHTMMNQTQLGEASQYMDKMSKNMHALSERMREGNFDDKDLAMMQERNKEMLKHLNQLEQQLKN